MTIPLLLAIDVAPENQARLRDAGFEPLPAAGPDRMPGSRAAEIRAVLTNGSSGFSAAQIAALPALEIVCALGAGYEKIDLAAASARGITVTNGAGTNDVAVADHAMMLLLATVRGVVQADAAARRGEWAGARQLRPSVSGKRLGLLGLGHIGQRIAERGAGGFGMEVAYHSRRPREGSPFRHEPDLGALASWCDFLVVAAPGGAETRHLVDAAVLRALGPGGFLVNIARGSVVDTGALIEALEQERIAGAGLDVVEGEPDDIPARLTRLENVILTPHIAGRSPEAVLATVRLVIDNLRAHFSGQPVLTPVSA
ncbi:hydroxyacid dehydrogenase [Roseomonas gilardii]|uniref:Hydroxyacid dehydrogenase n=1 Tax=Roseomonas gilardii TaxID=257708 RepID=A0A1L7ADR9_9PROT|nr:2-hydroxyacid dehydrogenase [Roseomonas gilardii]APT56938.1 hydroxyacid dehydrogenase [Roseomonas gilardii]